MRTCAGLLLVAAFCGLAWADEAADKLAEQKKAAAAAWEAIEGGAVATVETKHLLIYAPKASEKTLKATGALLERYFEKAMSVLALDPKELPAGKLTVYLLAERETMPTFIRRVEKRRPETGQTASYSASDERFHVAAAPSAGKVPVPAEVRAGEQIATVLLVRKAGVRTPLPGWLVKGFGRATTYRLSPKDKVTVEERKQARALAKSRKPADVFNGTIDPEEADALYGSLGDFMAYGPGASFFAKFLDGFKPEENVESKTTAQALEHAGLKPEGLEKSWKKWAASQK